jgi:hypothetical protein
VTRLGSMPGIRATLSALAVVACAAGLAACGGDEEGGPIPQDAGEALIAQLDEIERAVQEGDCDAAQATALAFAQRVDDLPAEVSGELRTRLVEASANLEALIPTQCEAAPATGPTGETGVVPTTTDTTTSTTETTTTDTTTDEPPPETDEDDEGGDDQSGSGNAGGGPGAGGSGEGGDSSGGIGSDG